MQNEKILLLAILGTIIGCLKEEATLPTEEGLDASSTIDSADVSYVPSESPEVRSAIRLTDAAKAEVLEIMQQSDYLRVGIRSGGCLGFTYELGVDKQFDSQNDTLCCDDGVKVIADHKSAKLLYGLTIDWQERPDGEAGFVFENPNEPKSDEADALIDDSNSYGISNSDFRSNIGRETAMSSYSFLDSPEAQQPIDPEVEVVRLLTEDRQAAFLRLSQWWKENQPSVRSPYGLTHVEQYNVEGRPIYVLFNRRLGESEGAFSLVDSKGRLIRIFKNMNYLGSEDKLIDLTGDGIPEFVMWIEHSGKYKDRPNQVVTVAPSIAVLPINADTSPLLHVVYGKRLIGETPSWRWSLDVDESGVGTVQLFKDSQSEPNFQFHWNADKGKFIGPFDSANESFIARCGPLQNDVIHEFVRPK